MASQQQISTARQTRQQKGWRILRPQVVNPSAQQPTIKIKLVDPSPK